MSDQYAVSIRHSYTPCRMRHSMDMSWSYGIGT